jgi:hypothetical protein
MNGFACVFCPKGIDPTRDRWLWLQMTSRKELVPAHRTCYERASARRLHQPPASAVAAVGQPIMPDEVAGESGVSVRSEATHHESVAHASGGILTAPAGSADCQPNTVKPTVGAAGSAVIRL